ncbi:NAD-dependent epimerase/dehydratase family protein [Glaciecola sp. 2405UD65-10]|uniref:NAD-dependent epimerase/dehydratase family protein n=1 Tax=Glaciecola sp. 2405UD65-10 TaxID=3397244 RepID=UPI003B5B1E46
MLVVTGAAGFVGANLIKLLNSYGRQDIIAIDSFKSDEHWGNLVGLDIYDFLDYRDGVDAIITKLSECNISGIFHIGANADVMCQDFSVMMNDNFVHSKAYFEFAKQQKVPFVFASTSAIYGLTRNCFVDKASEKPHNIYGMSKLMFDNYLRANDFTELNSRVVSLRFFNVFGQGESHKGHNASIPRRFTEFLQTKGFIDVFDEQIDRDYIHVDDLCEIIWQAFSSDEVSNGIYNAGCGTPISHHEIAGIAAKVFSQKNNVDEQGLVTTIALPENLQNKFQFYTCAMEVPEWIANRATNNKEKIANYIESLL